MGREGVIKRKEPESIVEKVVEDRIAAAGGVLSDELGHGADKETHGERG